MSELLAGDLYQFQNLLRDDERQIIEQVRRFLRSEVAPIANDCWAKAEFPTSWCPGTRSSASPACRTRNVPTPRRAACSPASWRWRWRTPTRRWREGTREINTMIVGRAVTGESAFV